MTDQTEQDTEAAVDPVAAAVECLRNLVAVIKPVPVEQVREAFGGIIPIIERDKLLIGLYVPAIAEVLAALDSAQGRAERLAKERAGWRSIAGVDEIEADRDRLAARVAELEDRLQARAADELTHMDQWMEENDTLRKRVAELEGEREHSEIEWAWRSASVDGVTEVIWPARNQADAEDQVLQRRLNLNPTRCYQVLKRYIGPWRAATNDAGESGDETGATR